MKLEKDFIYYLVDRTNQPTTIAELKTKFDFDEAQSFLFYYGEYKGLLSEAILVDALKQFLQPQVMKAIHLNFNVKLLGVKYQYKENLSTDFIIFYRLFYLLLKHDQKSEFGIKVALLKNAGLDIGVFDRVKNHIKRVTKFFNIDFQLREVSNQDLTRLVIAANLHKICSIKSTPNEHTFQHIFYTATLKQKRKYDLSCGNYNAQYCIFSHSQNHLVSLTEVTMSDILDIAKVNPNIIKQTSSRDIRNRDVLLYTSVSLINSNLVSVKEPQKVAPTSSELYTINNYHDSHEKIKDDVLSLVKYINKNELGLAIIDHNHITIKLNNGVFEYDGEIINISLHFLQKGVDKLKKTSENKWLKSLNNLLDVGKDFNYHRFDGLSNEELKKQVDLALINEVKLEIQNAVFKFDLAKLEEYNVTLKSLGLPNILIKDSARYPLYKSTFTMQYQDFSSHAEIVKYIAYIKKGVDMHY